MESGQGILDGTVLRIWIFLTTLLHLPQSAVPFEVEVGMLWSIFNPTFFRLFFFPFSHCA